MNKNEAYDEAMRLVRLWNDRDFVATVQARLRYEAKRYRYIVKLMDDRAKPPRFSRN